MPLIYVYILYYIYTRNSSKVWLRKNNISPVPAQNRDLKRVSRLFHSRSSLSQTIRETKPRPARIKSNKSSGMSLVGESPVNILRGTINLRARTKSVHAFHVFVQPRRKAFSPTKLVAKLPRFQVPRNLEIDATNRGDWPILSIARPCIPWMLLSLLLRLSSTRVFSHNSSRVFDHSALLQIPEDS